MKLYHRYPFLLFLVFSLGCKFPVYSTTAVPSVFSDHMILQRQMAVPIWGTAPPNQSVTVTFHGQSQTCVADADGRWSVKLTPMEAGGPEAMKIQGDTSLNFTDIYVGEVWVGSGQSNMAMGAQYFISPTTPPPGDSKDTPLAGVQNMTEVAKGGPYPEIHVLFSGRAQGWQTSGPATLNSFSAQLQCFGAVLQKKLKVPVGLMLGAVGGTPSGRWIPLEALRADPAIQAEIAEAKKTYSPEADQAKYHAAQKKYQDTLAAWQALPPDQQAKSRQPGQPKPPPAPGESEYKIGDLYNSVIKPFVGYGIRGVLWDQGESGTAVRGVEQFVLMGALIKAWRQEWNQGDFPFLYVQKPSGGGCAFDPADPVYGWSAQAFVAQPANIPPVDVNKLNFLKTALYPATYMVPVGDLGGGLHPVNKFAYGSRDATVALGAVYGQNLEISGPIYAESGLESGKLRIKFTHVGKGLTFKNGDKLQGFAVAGADKHFYWAHAEIEGTTVIVFAPEVAEPLFVRYAWANPSSWANLFNLDGLPALPFRTDP